jgi:hypothetical protein
MPGETTQFSETKGYVHLDPLGQPIVQNVVSGLGPKIITNDIWKVWLTNDAFGYMTASPPFTSFPMGLAMAPGTPGLNGVNTDCSTLTSASPLGAIEMASNYLPTPPSGNMFFGQAYINIWNGSNGSHGAGLKFIDIVWINTGINVTTLTAQTTTTPTLPARDNNGSSNGDGYQVALMTTAANTNATAIANTTISYTDSDNNAGNTGIFQAAAPFQAPATPVLGTFVPFSLAAGDRGVRALTSITLATSYATGSLSEVIYRELTPFLIGNIGGMPTSFSHINGQVFLPGTRVYNGSCIAVVMNCISTCTMSPAGSFTIINQ